MCVACEKQRLSDYYVNNLYYIWVAMIKCSPIGTSSLNPPSYTARHHQ